MTAYGEKLWQPTAARAAKSRLSAFEAWLAARGHGPFPDYGSLHRWTLDAPGAFWQSVAAFSGVIWQREPGAAIFEPPPAGKMRGARWFPGAALNYAENLLRPSLGAASRPSPHETLLISHAEGAPRRTFSAASVHDAVAGCARALAACGVGPGDCVAGVIGNLPEAIVAMLATASLGAIWASCSPDFGAAAVIDRLAQVEPKVVFFTEKYWYGDKPCDCAATITAVVQGLSCLKKAVTIDHLQPAGLWAKGFEEFISERCQPDRAGTAGIAFAPRSFDDPLFVLFSSGTTGVPKCITHGVGGTLLQHLKEHALHGDIGPGDRLLYYTTCGWMMWNWMASALAAGASLVLYEGSVAAPDLGELWRIARDEGVTHLGTSPKFIAACMQAGLRPREVLGNRGPRTIFSTGSPLLPEHFAWVYRDVADDLHLASISGGTDIVSCFMLGNPKAAVYAGEIQALGLGMAVEAWNDQQQPVLGEKGELVCIQPFPSMPVCFWNDASGKKYESAYFTHFHGKVGETKEVWRHGDFIEVTAHGGVVVFGRSDATLNPGGVRIGTAELYRQVEKIADIADSVAVGEKTEDGDERIVLFVKMAPGAPFSDNVVKKVKDTIRSALTPRHVPANVVAVEDVPYTRSGKKVEIAVQQAIHGEEVKNLSALANPEAMNSYTEYARTRLCKPPV